MKQIVIDIETAGLGRDEIQPAVAEELERWAQSAEDPARVYDEQALNPLTGRVIAIGMLNLSTGRGRVHHQPQGAAPSKSSDGLAELIPGSEADILRSFWGVAAKADQVITFNGRGFDIPFVVDRSVAHEISPTANLMPNRYSGEGHIDLMDRLSYYRAVRIRSLHYYCLLYGIDSPKQGVISTTSVAELWEQGRHQELADYCWGDVKATAQLYEKWAKYVAYPPKA